MNAYPAAIVYLSKHMQYAGWWVINNLFPYFLYWATIPTPLFKIQIFLKI